MMTACPKAHYPEVPPRDSIAPLLIVLLGASNLARAHWALTKYLRKGLGARRVEFLTAMGPGRGYCVEGGIFNVRYPAIVETTVLDIVRGKVRMGWRVIALVTDIGNDVMYGTPADQVIRCLDRMLTGLRGEGNANVVVTTIHVNPFEDMGEFYFRVLRTLFFPASPVQYEEAASAVDKINRFLDEKTDVDLHVIKDMKRYAGWDRIHFSLFKSHRGWTRVADQMLHCVKLEPTGKISRLEMITSAFYHIVHLFVCDMFRWRRRRSGTFQSL